MEGVEGVADSVSVKADLSIISAPEQTSAGVQLVSDGSTVYLHTRSEYHQVIPLADNFQEIVYMWPFVYKESHWMSVYGDL